MEPIRAESTSIPYVKNNSSHLSKSRGRATLIWKDARRQAIRCLGLARSLATRRFSCNLHPY
jgi:hypothetical protein